MSEEEKETIERIKQEIDRYKAIETPKEVYITDIKILLSLIKNQQKEIEELKEKSKKCEYYEMVADDLYKNSINKDKIRDKIKELEKKKNCGNSIVFWEISSQIDLLKELLEEE